MTQLNDIQETSGPDRLVEGVFHLITLPDIWFRLQDILQDPNHDWNDVAQLITYDHALTAKILRMVNSAYFGMPRRIERLSHAINIIGEDELNQLVLSASVVQGLDSIVSEFPNIEDYWLHGVRVAILSRLIAEHRDVLHPERMFVAGLLHDAGKLVIYQQMPEIGAWLYADSARDPEKVMQLERAKLGFDHASVGGALARAWELPESLVHTIENHHSPDAGQDFVLETNIIHTANALVNLAESPLEPELDNVDYSNSISGAALEICRLEPDKVSEMMIQALVESQIVKEIICGGAAVSLTDSTPN